MDPLLPVPEGLVFEDFGFDPLALLVPLPFDFPLALPPLSPPLLLPFAGAGRLVFPLPGPVPFVVRRFSDADASIAASAAGAGRLVFPLEPSVPFDLVVPFEAAPPVDFGFGRGRSLRSAGAAFVPAPFSPTTGGGGGPPTMPFRNRISCVRIRIALETMK